MMIITLHDVAASICLGMAICNASVIELSQVFWLVSSFHHIFFDFDLGEHTFFIFIFLHDGQSLKIFCCWIIFAWWAVILIFLGSHIFVLGMMGSDFDFDSLFIYRYLCVCTRVFKSNTFLYFPIDGQCISFWIEGTNTLLYCCLSIQWKAAKEAMVCFLCYEFCFLLYFRQ